MRLQVQVTCVWTCQRSLAFSRGLEDQGELCCHEAAGSGKLSSGAPPPALPNLANIRLTASYLGACGEMVPPRLSLCPLFIHMVPNRWAPLSRYLHPLELARWSRQREGDVGSALGESVCGNEAGVGYWREVQTRPDRSSGCCLWKLPATVGLMDKPWQGSTLGFILSFCGGGCWLSRHAAGFGGGEVAFAVAAIWPLRG